MFRVCPEINFTGFRRIFSGGQGSGAVAYPEVRKAALTQPSGKKTSEGVKFISEQTLSPSLLLVAFVILSCLPLLTLRHAAAQQSEAFSGQVQPPLSDETIWQQFLEWMKGVPQADSPSSFFLAYRTYLTSIGTPAGEIARRLDVAARMMRERADGWRVIFNNIYRTTNPGFVTEPNALLVSTVEGRKPGRALDIGMGQGRNAVFLALKGWDVTGFDVSDEGLEVARKSAERAGVSVNAIRETDQDFDYGADRWDLIIFLYNPLPVTAEAYVERLSKSLRTGGLIIIETHAPDNRLASQLPTVADPDRLLAAFKDFRLLHFEDAAGKPDWMSETTDRIVRMVVEKRQ
jgi:2-polyprenyl-3-methyl-5-hydroxy-6-metoxy-1,4-benzoquinol methylase